MGVNERIGTRGFRDLWNRPMRCPNPGCADKVKRFQIMRYEGIWVRLRCPDCGTEFKVRSKVGGAAGVHIR